MKNLSISNNDKLVMISELATMISAGIPLLEVVDSLITDSKGNQKKILLTLKDDLSQGKTIAESLSKFSNSFDPVTVNIIKAAEQAGNLDTALKDLTINIKRDMEFMDKVKAALTYPLVIIVVFVFVVLIILTFVIPRVSAVFSKLKVVLPLPTKILITVSNFFLAYTWQIIVFTVIGILGLTALYKIKKSFFLNVFFSLPLLSNLAREIDLVRFTRSFSLLLNSGIPISEALELSLNVVYKKDVRQVLSVSRDMVISGRQLSEGLKASKKVIPSIVVRITEAGEKSGGLHKSMQELSEYYDLQVSNTLKTLTTLLEPALLVIMGLMVGGLMLSIIAPIYNLIGQIKGR